MKKFTLTVLLLLCALGSHADLVTGEKLAAVQPNSTKFDFANVSFDWEALTSSAYTNETEGIQNSDNDVVLYIHTDADKPIFVYAWDGDNNKFLGEFPGTQLTEFKAVSNKNNLSMKKGYWKLQIPNKTSFSFIVSQGTDADECSKTQSIETILNGAGVYFLDYKSVKDSKLSQTDAYNQSQQYQNLSSTVVHVRVIDSDVWPYVYAYWNPSEYYTQENASWPGARMEEEWIGGEKWYKSYIWNADWSNGAIIFNDNGNKQTQTSNISSVEPGDNYYYYYPNGYGDRYKAMGFLNKPSSQTNYKEYDFTPQTIESENISAELETPTKINFAELENDGFTLSISNPKGLKMQDMIVDSKLRLYLNSTITFKQNDGHYINMLAYGGFKGSGNVGDFTNKEALDTYILNQAGHFNTPATQPIDHLGNDYTLVGGEDASSAFKHVAEVDTDVVSYTFTDPNYGINREFIEFDSIRVRENKISSSLVDLYGVYRGFAWEITSPMVVVRYSGGGTSVPAGIGENITGEGIIYCRSLEPSRTYTFPQPTEEQKAKGRVYNNKPYSASDLFEVTNFTNYDWLAIRLTGDMKKQWDEMNPNDYLNHVIKPNTIKGYYCDFIGNQSRLATAYLNPTIVAQRMPVLDNGEEYEDVIAEGTKLNNYYLFSFTRQDDVFFIPPKRNEVCNLYFVIPELSDNALYGCKWDFVDNEGTPFELKSKVRVYGYYTTDGQTVQNGDDSQNVYPEMNIFKNIYSQKYHDKRAMCKAGETAIIRDALVQMINHHGEKHYLWQQESYDDPYGNEDASYLRTAPKTGYYYHPEDDNDGDNLGYLLPMVDYGGGGDVITEDGQIVKYYGVFPQHRLAINPNLAARNPKNSTYPYTSIEEIMSNSNSIKLVDYVEYYNVSGQRSNSPFSGFNIMVRHYTDGTMSAKKIMNPTK